MSNFPLGTGPTNGVVNADWMPTNATKRLSPRVKGSSEIFQMRFIYRERIIGRLGVNVTRAQGDSPPQLSDVKAREQPSEAIAEQK